MAIIRNSFLLLAFCFAASGQITTNITFGWNDPPNIYVLKPAEYYRFYEKIGGTNLLLGSGITSNRFTVNGWIIGSQRTFTVTLVNPTYTFPESDECIPYVSNKPVKPSGLNPVPMSFIIPIPGDLLLSEDLIRWDKTFHVEWAALGNAGVMFTSEPNHPLLFGKVR